MSNESNDPSLYFYLLGRDDIAEGRIKNAEVDLGELTGKISSPTDVAKLCRQAAVDALSSQSASSVKRAWCDDHKDAIKDTGLAADIAWKWYLEGQIAEFAAILDTEVVEELNEQFSDDGDDGSGDQEGEDGGAEDDDEDGADGEDEDDDDGEDELDKEPENVKH